MVVKACIQFSFGTLLTASSVVFSGCMADDDVPDDSFVDVETDPSSFRSHVSVLECDTHTFTSTEPANQTWGGGNHVDCPADHPHAIDCGCDIANGEAASIVLQGASLRDDLNPDRCECYTQYVDYGSRPSHDLKALAKCCNG